MYEKYWFVLPVHEIARRTSRMDTDEEKTEGIVRAKVVAMAALGLSALACSILPIAITKFLSRGKGLGSRGLFYLGILLRFGGGILLATTFIHLLPEVREGYENLQDVTPSLKSWPSNLPELIMCAGFFMMYGIEEAAHKCLHKSHGHTESRTDCIEGPRARTAEPRSSTAGTSRTDPNRAAEENKGHSHVMTGGAPVRGLLIIIALSVHQIFEGLAIGLEGDRSHVWMLLGAVAAHKLVIALCVGFEIAMSRISLTAATGCVAIFAIASPIGIGIGIGLSSGSQPSEGIDIASIVLQGFATGTLLFVVFFEVLTKSQEEHDSGSNTGLIHFFAAILGFALMCVLLYSITD